MKGTQERDLQDLNCNQSRDRKKMTSNVIYRKHAIFFSGNTQDNFLWKFSGFCRPFLSGMRRIQVLV